MSLLQNHRRPSSDLLDSELPGGRNPADAFGAQDRAVELDRDLDFSAERPPTTLARSGRGPGVLVAAIVASSLTLAGVIMLVRSNASEASVSEPAEPPPKVDVVAAPAEPPTALVPIEPAPAEHAPVEPSRVASQQSHPSLASEPAQPPKPVEITPAAITPAAITPASPAVQPVVAPGELAPSTLGGTGAAGHQLPAPSFEEPTPPSPPAPTPVAPTSVDDASDPLPGIEESAAFHPRDEAPADAPEPEAGAVVPTNADAPDAAAPIDLDAHEHAPAHADHPRS